MEDPDIERKEWRIRYNPRTLGLKNSFFVENKDNFIKDEEFFRKVETRINDFEEHIGERLPLDFRKYLLYCGPWFHNYGTTTVQLTRFNECDNNDDRPYCIWCDQLLIGTKCTVGTAGSKNKWFNGELNKNGLVMFSQEGNTYKFIAVKGPFKDTIWYSNSYNNSLIKDNRTFIQILNDIYIKKKYFKKLTVDEW